MTEYDKDRTISILLDRIKELEGKVKGVEGMNLKTKWNGQPDIYIPPVQQSKNDITIPPPKEYR